ncbi:3D domain-containing protein [Pontibacillus litoralis]|uniref:3D domain-containing protein n=1 Tax=Pontibacillus litoralis JSM 072002 TaxID=1385512 RepID=A0A0A5HNC9_9BACI|nr:3D domain-containing protein [Pontibacillus litoralis]KGX85142.1 hypothetical protein N784_10165 [Pontibacillus litoralis JSM 072002]
MKKGVIYILFAILLSISIGAQINTIYADTNVKEAMNMKKKQTVLAVKKETPKLTKNQAREVHTNAQAIDYKQQPTSTKTMVMEATAYTANCTGCSGITRTGQNLKANPNQKVIAVDPTIIPLGSKVHVEGYGTAIAGDTGGDIKGNRIDLFIPNRQNALKYGRQQVTIEIIE